MLYLKSKGCCSGELVVANVHFHYMFANRSTKDGAHHFKGVFEILGETIMKYGVRLLAGDFNMALWMVIPTLRSMGVQANMVA